MVAPKAVRRTGKLLASKPAEFGSAGGAAVVYFLGRLYPALTEEDILNLVIMLGLLPGLITKFVNWWRTK